MNRSHKNINSHVLFLDWKNISWKEMKDNIYWNIIFSNTTQFYYQALLLILKIIYYVFFLVCRCFIICAFHPLTSFPSRSLPTHFSFSSASTSMRGDAKLSRNNERPLGNLCRQTQQISDSEALVFPHDQRFYRILSSESCRIICSVRKCCVLMRKYVLSLSQSHLFLLCSCVTSVVDEPSAREYWLSCVL